jgi:hypothetical protein
LREPVAGGDDQPARAATEGAAAGHPDAEADQGAAVDGVEDLLDP